MELEKGTIAANGLTFAYLASGSPSAPLALCLHGFPDTAWTFRHLLPSLAEAGFRAVAPFMRGYAPTEIPADGRYSVAALVQDVAALHQELGGDDRSVLIGHDWGAAATYAAAAPEPSRWRRAVAMSVPPWSVLASAFLDYEQLKRFFYMFLFQTPVAETAVSADGMAFLDRLWADWSPGYDATADLEYVKACLREPENLTAALGYYRAMFVSSARVTAYAAEQRAARRSGERPILYLHGADDGCLPAGRVSDVERHLPAGSRAELVPGAGHFPHLERSAAVNTLIMDWFRR